MLGEKTCKSPEEFKAWSQNLGHDHVLTTFTSYGNLTQHRQDDILEAMAERVALPTDGPDPETMRIVVAHLVKQAG